MRHPLKAGLLLSLVAVFFFSGPTVGQQGTRGLVPVPFNATRPINVQVSTDRSSLKIGETVTVCYQISRAGYVTLWNIGADGKVVRIFPNAFTPSTAAAMHVTDTSRRCVGSEGDAFRFQVVGPPGIDELYLLWTADATLQPKTASHPDPGKFAADLARVGQAGPDRWATAKSAFDINDPAQATAPPRPPAAAPVPPAAPVVLAPPPAPVAPPAVAAPPTPVPPPAPALPSVTLPGAAAPAPALPPVTLPGSADGPRVYLLAMGADVRPLTKTNSDARLFAAAMQQRYSIPRDNLRYYENVYKPQFRAGMGWLRERARPQDFVIIYFSGHGAQARDRSGRSPDGRAEAFVTYEAQTKPQTTADDVVWSWEFVSMLNAIPAGTVLTVIDACHSAGLYRSIEGAVLGAKEKYFELPSDMEVEAPAEAATRSVVPLSSAKGTLLAAARRDQSALEGQMGGLFTLALTRIVADNRSGTMAGAFDLASRQVGQGTRNRQIPTLVGTQSAAERFPLSGALGQRR
jgi:hypothetical protein